MSSATLTPPTGAPAAGRKPDGQGASKAAPAPVAVSYIRWLDQTAAADIGTVGGKGANLGEMAAAGLPVPPGFVVAVDAWHAFAQGIGLADTLRNALTGLDLEDSDALQRAAKAIQQRVREAPVPGAVRQAILDAYHELADRVRIQSPGVAVRSSATVEDTAQYSFAGMFESYLNVHGDEAVLTRVRDCWASAFGARVLYYRLKQGMDAALSIAVIVQRMVNAEKAGVMFTVDPATRDAKRVVIEAAWGLGEVVVGGQVTPDRYVVDKDTLAVRETHVARKEFMLVRDEASGDTVRVDLLDHDQQRGARVLSEAELRVLGELAKKDEAHYGKPQDIEFAFAGGKLYVTQTRPITTLGRETGEGGGESPVAAPAAPPGAHEEAIPVLHGLGASPGLAHGPVRILGLSSEESKLRPGEILVTHMTSPDWVPVMRRAAAIITDAGGMTSHAAIVSRELGIPCIVGTRVATKTLRDGQIVSLDATTGMVWSGDHAPEPVKGNGLAGVALPVSTFQQPMGDGAIGGSAERAYATAVSLAEARAQAPTSAGAKPAPPPTDIPRRTSGATPAIRIAGVTEAVSTGSRPITATKIYVNLAEPDLAARVAAMDVDGVGLLRAEFMMLAALNGMHPRRLLNEGRGDELVRRLADALRVFGRAFAPRPVIYRAIDFRSNEFRGLAGGEAAEPHEENPMIGYRGCFRYTREPDLFALELRALLDARADCPNIHLMIPFVRTGSEFRACKAIIDGSGLTAQRDFQLWVMAEVPSVVTWLDEYVKLGVTGVSIGSNDLTQLILGVDRDSELLSSIYDERDPAVLAAVKAIIDKCRALGVTCSICGQAPSTHEGYAEQLVRWGIDSVSVNPDVLGSMRRRVAVAERKILLEAARR